MTSFNFKDKTALVTGGSSGIGAAVVELFRD
jgi:NAD(P)-dependent dehydrogenase (short-subunit alcohol dehydrogenase family)